MVFLLYQLEGNVLVSLSYLKNKIFLWGPFSISIVILIIIFYCFSKYFEHHSKTSISKNRIYPQLSALLMFILGIIILILNSPLTENTKGQLLSFVGILLTAAIALSSPTFLGNIMAGLMIKSLKKYIPGDFLRVGENFGRVTEVGLLHTEIQTEDRDLTTLPNILLITTPLKVIHSCGTLIGEEVSLGYNASRNTIKESLILAAEKTNLSEPFVHIKCLGDFSVTYRISGFLSDVKKIISTKALLCENILDTLHENKIEIVSPTFMNQRVFNEKSVFIPQVQIDTKEDEKTISPENIMFDKANEAESKEKLKSRLLNIDQEIAGLKSQTEVNGKKENTIIQNKITKLKELKDKIYKILKSNKELPPK